MGDGMLVEFVHRGHDAVLEFLFGCDPDVARDRAGKLGKETLDEIEQLGAIAKHTSLWDRVGAVADAEYRDDSGLSPWSVLAGATVTRTSG